MARMRINGQALEIAMESGTPLLWALRDAANLTGTKQGCGSGQCGACTVVVDGAAALSCMLPIGGLEGAEVVTVEGLANHPIVEALVSEGAIQCGFCTPGFLMLAVNALETNPDLSDEEILEVLSSNLCRCTGYQNIVKAVRIRAADMRRTPAR